MKVLMRIDPDTRLPDMTQDALAMQAFNQLSDIYNSEVGLSDSYLLPPGNMHMAAQFLDFTDGKLFPEIIKETAKSWNKTIEDTFTNAMMKLLSNIQPDTDGRYNWYKAPSVDIYEMKKAAMALDGDFYEFAEHAVIVNEHMSLGTYLHKNELKDILYHPQNYAVLSVSPK